MDSVINGWCYKGTLLQRNYRIMTMKWSFSCINSFIKFHGKKNGSHNMTMLCPNFYYNEVSGRYVNWMSTVQGKSPLVQAKEPYDNLHMDTCRLSSCNPECT